MEITGSSREDLTVRRISGTWTVGAEELPDLLSAIVFADLLAAEVDQLETAPRPAREPEPADELERLSLTVRQLERALSARVVTEQAIGVLSERLRLNPRQSFEKLRGLSRNSGRRVHDLAADVVRSATEDVGLPKGLHQES